MTSDNIYYNIIFNHNNVNGEIPTIAQYSFTNTIPILNKPDDYYCSIIRFSIPLSEVPLYIMRIVPNQGNPNLTPMIIGIKYNNNYYYQNIVYSPDNNLPVPVQNQPSQVITPYYYVYSYQNLLNAINSALVTQYAAFVTANPGAPQASPNVAPFIYYNPTTKLFSLVIEQSWATTGSNQALLYGNELLFNYLDAFETYFYGFNQPNGLDYSFQIYNDPSNLSGTVYTITQEYSSINNWNSLQKILLTTLSIPIAQEFLPTMRYASQSSTAPIITDFIPILDGPGETRSVAVYNPTTQYRLVNMLGTTPLMKIDLNLYWSDHENNIYPIYISNGNQASVKIGFFNKKMYNSFSSLLLK